MGAHDVTPERRPPAVSTAKLDALAQAFSERLERIAAAVDGSLAYVVVDLTSGQRVAARADEPFPTASTIKIGILYELFRQGDDGMLVLDEPLPLPDRSRVGGAGVLPRLHSPVISLRDHAQLMIMLSDNTATNVLIDAVGRDRVNARMRALGATGYRLQRKMMDVDAAARGEENLASPNDLLVVLDALRTGRGLQPASRDAALAMLRAPGSTALRRGVATGVPVAGKSGDLDGVRAEIAWVDVPARPYLIAVMGTLLADEPDAEQAITEMSAAAYRYFSRLGRAGAEGRLLPH
ncbi:MAG: serine hydrolase [Luteitalea sp.]